MRSLIRWSLCAVVLLSTTRLAQSRRLKPLQVDTPAPTVDPNNPETCGNCLIADQSRGGCSISPVSRCVEDQDPLCRTQWDQRCVEALQTGECMDLCPARPTDPAAIVEQTGLTVGWIFSIVVLSALVLYFCLGVCIKSRKGNSGMDLLPNPDLWRNLPGLVKDGCFTSWYCIVGKPKDSYDFIDERDSRRGAAGQSDHFVKI